MEALWDVAPPDTWALLAAAAALLLTGFVLLSHGLLRRKGYRDRWAGLIGRGPLECSLRVGSACLFAGVLLWGLDLGWATPILATLAAAATLAAGLEAASRIGRG